MLKYFNVCVFTSTCVLQFVVFLELKLISLMFVLLLLGVFCPKRTTVDLIL